MNFDNFMQVFIIFQSTTNPRIASKNITKDNMDSLTKFNQKNTMTILATDEKVTLSDLSENIKYLVSVNSCNGDSCLTPAATTSLLTLSTGETATYIIYIFELLNT